MRLLYAYFDTESGSDPTASDRGLSEYGLVFSTTHTFKVEREPREGITGNRYTLSGREREKKAQLPGDFWGKRIYNISALVGDNGSGKSTILHNLIKALVKGLKPGVPFFLVLQDTPPDLSKTKQKVKNEKLRVYYGSPSENDVFAVEESGVLRGARWSTDYPKQLERAKIMLLDNTLSVSSVELDSLYSAVLTGAENKTERRLQPRPIPESYKQLFNKSLFASIRYSNGMSRAEQPDYYSYPITEEFFTHFRYETYQELRFLFDPQERETVKALIEAENPPGREDGAKEKLPFPRPRFVYVRAMDVDVLRENVSDKYRLRQREMFGLPKIFREYYRFDFWQKLISAALFVPYCVFRELLSDFQERTNERLFDDKYLEIIEILDNENAFHSSHLDKQSEQSALASVEKALEHTKDFINSFAAITFENIEAEESARSKLDALGRIVEKSRGFIECIENYAPSLDRVFWEVSQKTPGASQGDGLRYDRKIDIDAVISNKTLLDQFIDFLEHYREASETMYFMIFSTGLSSGEKNLLRMLTQFRYAFSNRKFTERSASESKDDYKLRNVLVKRQEKTENQKEEKRVYENTCDTLFLFLDEADLTYHPEWQRTFVSVLTKTLPAFFRDSEEEGEGCKDIQVVMATHSPLLLSDIPLQNCTFLRTETVEKRLGSEVTEKRSVARVIDPQEALMPQTFGANIHSLLNNSFFLNRTIGGFARQKILETHNALKRLEEDPETSVDRETREAYLTVIEMIGDPIVRNKLLRLYQRCFPPEKDLNAALSNISGLPEMSADLTPQQRTDIAEALEAAAREIRGNT